MKTIKDIKGIDDMIGQVIQADCLDVMRLMKDKSVDLVLTDPPYPDYYTEEYGYKDGIIDFLKDLPCRQFIFWSAKVDFPLDYTAIHIWNKKCGVGSMYERIFERNGKKEWKVYDYYLINSSVAANYAKDVFTGHPSQKNIHLLKKIISESTNEGDIIFDPFMGSWTTAVAAESLNRRWIGTELSSRYCKVGEERLKLLRSQPKLI